jgi:hypothetical protein
LQLLLLLLQLQLLILMQLLHGALRLITMTSGMCTHMAFSWHVHTHDSVNAALWCVYVCLHWCCVQAAQGLQATEHETEGRYSHQHAYDRNGHPSYQGYREKGEADTAVRESRSPNRHSYRDDRESTHMPHGDPE